MNDKNVSQFSTTHGPATIMLHQGKEPQEVILPFYPDFFRYNEVPIYPDFDEHVVVPLELRAIASRSINPDTGLAVLTPKELALLVKADKVYEIAVDVKVNDPIAKYAVLDLLYDESIVPKSGIQVPSDWSTEKFMEARRYYLDDATRDERMRTAQSTFASEIEKGMAKLNGSPALVTLVRYLPLNVFNGRPWNETALKPAQGRFVFNTLYLVDASMKFIENNTMIWGKGGGTYLYATVNFSGTIEEEDVMFLSTESVDGILFPDEARQASALLPDIVSKIFSEDFTGTVEIPAFLPGDFATLLRKKLMAAAVQFRMPRFLHMKPLFGSPMKVETFQVEIATD